MDMELTQVVATGGVAAFLFQMLKGDWNRWLTVVIAVAGAFGAGYMQAGYEGGIMAAATALGVHSTVLAKTPLGQALKLEVLPRTLRIASKMLADMAAAIENKPKP